MARIYCSGQVFQLPARGTHPAILVRIALPLAAADVPWESPLGIFRKSLLIQVSAEQEFSSQAFAPANLAMSSMVALAFPKYAEAKALQIAELPLSIEEVEMPVFVSNADDEHGQPAVVIARGEVILRTSPLTEPEMKAAGCHVRACATGSLGNQDMFGDQGGRLVPHDWVLERDLRFHPLRDVVLLPGELDKPYYTLLAPERLAIYKAALRRPAK